MCIFFHLRMDQVLNTDDVFGDLFAKKMPIRQTNPCVIFRRTFPIPKGWFGSYKYQEHSNRVPILVGRTCSGKLRWFCFHRYCSDLAFIARCALKLVKRKHFQAKWLNLDLDLKKSKDWFYGKLVNHGKVPSIWNMPTGCFEFGNLTFTIFTSMSHLPIASPPAAGAVDSAGFEAGETACELGSSKEVKNPTPFSKRSWRLKSFHVGGIWHVTLVVAFFLRWNNLKLRAFKCRSTEAGTIKPTAASMLKLP